MSTSCPNCGTVELIKQPTGIWTCDSCRSSWIGIKEEVRVG